MKFNRKISRFFIFASAALLLVLLAQPAPAVADTWIGPKPNTLWSNPNNWSDGAPPSGPQDASLTSATTKTAFFDPPNASFRNLTVDATGGGTFTLSMPGNTLSVIFTETIGLNGKGQVVQSGGTNTAGNLEVGYGTGSSGTYTLSGGSLSTSTNQVLGDYGTGLFNQTGGNNTVGDTLTLGLNTSAVGTYNLSGGGQLQAQTQEIGNKGTGTFNQSGGNNNVTVDLLLGVNHTGVGTYNLSGGNLTTPDEIVGNQGTGTFTQNATSTNITSSLTLGNDASGSGTYTMKGGWLQTIEETVGDTGTGTFTQKGGTHIIGHDLTVGRDSTSNGAFTLLAGSLKASNEIIGSLGTGQFTQSGGTNTMNQLAVGFNANSSGTYTLNDGQLQSNSVEQIGEGGTGVFTQNGGTHTAKQLIIGDDSTGNGTFNLVKGTLSVTTNETIGNNGTGTFNQIGGTHTVGNQLILGNGAGNGTYNLQGGTLSVGTPFAGGTDIQIESGTSTFNVKNTTTTVTGDVANQGVVKTTNAKVTWNGNFFNSSAYTSNFSTQTFNNDLSMNNTGYLVGGSQDLFVVKNDFLNFSTSGSQWNTVLSTLQFVTGGDNSHNLYVVGADNGAHGQANNFTWGTLNLTGQKLVLFDGNATPGGALYAEAVIGATFSGTTLTDISNGDVNPINIYYNVHLAANAYLGGLSYTIPGGGGGMLIAHAPVPPSVLLLGSGLLGLGALGWRRKKVKS